MPLHKRRLGRAQEQDGMGNLLGRAHAAHRGDINCRSQGLPHLGVARGHGRLDDAGADAVDADAVGAVVDGVGARHVDHGGLGRAVRRRGRAGHDAELAGDVDDGAPCGVPDEGLLLEHLGQRRPRRQPRPPVVDVVDGVEDGRGRLGGPLRRGQDAGAVDGVVEAGECLGYARHERSLR